MLGPSSHRGQIGPAFNLGPRAGQHGRTVISPRSDWPGPQPGTRGPVSTIEPSSHRGSGWPGSSSQTQNPEASQHGRLVICRVRLGRGLEPFLDLCLDLDPGVDSPGRAGSGRGRLARRAGACCDRVAADGNRCCGHLGRHNHDSGERRPLLRHSGCRAGDSDACRRGRGVGGPVCLGDGRCASCGRGCCGGSASRPTRAGRCRCGGIGRRARCGGPGTTGARRRSRCSRRHGRSASATGPWWRCAPWPRETAACPR